MLKYVAARVGVLIPLLFGLSILVFLYIHVIPGNPVAGMLGPLERLRSLLSSAVNSVWISRSPSSTGTG